MSFIAVDVGTSACKAVRFTEDGSILSRATVAYSPTFPAPGHAELHPDIFWNALCTTLRKVAEEEGSPVSAVCISSHGETFIPLGASGKPAGSAILNMDNRAIAEAEQLDRDLGRRQLFERTGMIVHPMYPAAKLLWLREHQRSLFQSVVQFVSLTGYLLSKLGLPPYIDHTLASRFMLFDVRRRQWDEDLLHYIGVPETKLPPAVPAGTIAGTICATLASELGLRSQPIIVVGGHDQACAALGMGANLPGRVTDSIGTYECLVVATDEPVLNDHAYRASLNSYPHVVPGRYMSLAYFPSGVMVNWFRELVFADDTSPEKEQYRRLEGSMPEGPTGLCVLPHLFGTCNPDFNPRAKAVIAGLTAGTKRAHVYKGVLEGVACELAAVSQLLQDAIGSFSEISVSGGGTHSRLGLELRAALTGCRLNVMNCDEAVCIGSAILAGVAAGSFSGIDEAVSQLVRVGDTIEPSTELARQYTNQLRSYRNLYPALRPLREC
jgi:xylulokinase